MRTGVATSVAKHAAWAFAWVIVAMAILALFDVLNVWTASTLLAVAVAQVLFQTWFKAKKY